MEIEMKTETRGDIYLIVSDNVLKLVEGCDIFESWEEHQETRYWLAGYQPAGFYLIESGLLKEGKAQPAKTVGIFIPEGSIKHIVMDSLRGMFGADLAFQ